MRKLSSLPVGPELASLRPMTLSESQSRSLDGPEWVWELKYDGWRLLAQWNAGSVRLQTRGGADATRWFPEVTQSLKNLAHGRCVVDGELCVLDELGRPDFERLQTRARMRGWRAGADPVAYCVFDLLVFEDKNIMEWPLLERKELLASLWRPAPPSTLYLQHVESTEGSWLFEQSLQLRLEGVIAKRTSSIYQPGVRTLDWVKRKRPGAIPAQRFAHKRSR
jgi:bifunctional non-homologous end joining protein LigD